MGAAAAAALTAGTKGRMGKGPKLAAPPEVAAAAAPGALGLIGNTLCRFQLLLLINELVLRVL